MNSNLESSTDGIKMSQFGPRVSPPGFTNCCLGTNCQICLILKSWNNLDHLYHNQTGVLPSREQRGIALEDGAVLYHTEQETFCCPVQTTAISNSVSRRVARQHRKLQHLCGYWVDDSWCCLHWLQARHLHMVSPEQKTFSYCCVWKFCLH